MERNGLAISLRKTHVHSWHKITIQNVKSENSLAIFNDIISPIIKSNFTELFYIELKSYAVNLYVFVQDLHESDVLDRIRNRCLQQIQEHYFTISRIIEQTFLKDQFFHHNHCFYYWDELSKLIVSIFSKEKYTEQSLLLIAYHIHLVWILRCSNFKNESLQLTLLKGYVFQETATGPFDNIRLGEIYKSNKSLLDDIYTQVFNVVFNSKTKDNSWLNSWNDICLDYCKKNEMALNNSKTNYEIISYLIPDYLNTQLGITRNLKILLFSFLNRSLE